jgi:hypothetical protein
MPEIRQSSALTLLCAGLLLAALTAGAQEPIVYPAKGQSPDQVEQDKYQCYQWAKGETGFDPMAPPTATAPPPPNQAPTASTGRSAVGGAAAGSLIGGISDGNWGKGAAIGAVAGGLFGAHRKSSQQRQSQQAQQSWEQQQAQIYAQRRHEYNRAWTACLTGRGYTVN